MRLVRRGRGSIYIVRECERFVIGNAGMEAEMRDIGNGQGDHLDCGVLEDGRGVLEECVAG